MLGTGAGGLAAAVTGAARASRPSCWRRPSALGGTTAYSAGTCWIPGNRFQRADGVTDDVRSPAATSTRWSATGRPAELREAYLPAAARWSTTSTGSACGSGTRRRSSTTTRRSPASGLGGRALEPQTFDGRTLGKANFGRVRRPGAGVRAVRRHADGAPRRGQRAARRSSRAPPAGVRTALRLGVRWAADRLRYPRGTRLAMGNALVANLFHRLLARGGRVWFTATATRAAHRGRAGRRRRRRPPGPRAAGPRPARRGARGRRLLGEPGVAGALPAVADAAVHPRRRGRDRRHAGARPGRRRRARRAPRRQRVLVPQLRSAAAATARPRCSRTSGTAPSRASSR